MTGNAQMTAHHIDEGGITLGSPHCGRMAYRPEQETCDPEPQTETKGSCERAVDDSDRPGRTAHQDRFGQRAMHGRHEASDGFLHQIKTPPPNEKNDKKKLDAAKAIDRPNTIWISRRNHRGVAERERETRDDDDDHRDNLGDRAPGPIAGSD